MNFSKPRDDVVLHVAVNISAILLSTWDVNPTSSIFFPGALQMTWYDPRLDVSSSTKLLRCLDEVWCPDVQAITSRAWPKSSWQKSQVFQIPQATVSEGRVSWSVRGRFAATCSHGQGAFPFDSPIRCNAVVAQVPSTSRLSLWPTSETSISRAPGVFGGGFELVNVSLANHTDASHAKWGHPEFTILLASFDINRAWQPYWYNWMLPRVRYAPSDVLPTSCRLPNYPL